LDEFVVRFRVFKCTLVHAKRLFRRAVNGSFGKLLNLMPEVVILKLVSATCFLVLIWTWMLSTE